MSAFVIWCILPGAAAGALYVLRRFRRAVILAGVLTALLLAWLAWQFPIGASIPLRLGITLPPARIEPEHVLFGGRFVLADTTRPALVLLYLSAAFWFGGAGAARTHRLFVPLGLASLALICAALGAESVPAAALLLTLAVLLCVPIVSSPGEPTRRGAVRLLIIATCGLCLILFADGSLTAGLSPAPGVERDVNTSLLILALGFALILAVFPFHTWMTMLGEETNPYAGAFLFFLTPVAASFLALETLTHYSVAGVSPVMFTVLQYAGVLMTMVGGVGAALERHLGRIMAFAANAMLGMTLIALSLNTQLGRPTPLVGLYFAQLAPTGLGLAIWGLALTILRDQVGDLSYRSVRGAARRFPAACGVLLLANLSLAGLPLLAGFPVQLALWTALAQQAQTTALLASLGAAGLGVAALRSLAVMARPAPIEPASATAETPASAVNAAVTNPPAAETQPGPASASEPRAAAADAPVALAPSPALRWSIGETRLQVTLLGIGALLLFLAGCFPQVYLPTLTTMAVLFAGPAP